MKLQIANARLLWEGASAQAMRARLFELQDCPELNTPDMTAELRAIKVLLKRRTKGSFFAPLFATQGMTPC